MPVTKFNPFTKALDYYGGNMSDRRSQSGVDLVGAINGVNTTFTVPDGVYMSGSLNAYLNGIYQVPTENIIETSPATGVFDFVTAPLTGDDSVVLYKVSTDTAGINAETLQGFAPSDFTKKINGQVLINNVSDLAYLLADTSDGNGMAYHLEDGYDYLFATNFTNRAIAPFYDHEIIYPIIANADYGYSSLIGNGDSIVTLAYTGTGAMFRTSGGNLGQLSIVKLGLTTPNGTICDITANDLAAAHYFSIRDLFIFDCTGFGTIGENVYCDISFVSINDIGTGILIDNAESVFIGNQSQMAGWKDVGTSMITIQGNNPSTQVSLAATSIYGAATDTIFNIIPTDWAGLVVNGGIVFSDNIIFSPGSLDQKFEKIKFGGVNGVPDSATTGGYVIQSNATATTFAIVGADKTITAFASGGVGVTTVTSAAHGFTNGNSITLYDSQNRIPNYIGTYTISGVTANTFDISKTFVDNPAVGTAMSGWVKVVGTSYGLSQNERLSLTADSQITFTNLEDQSLIIDGSYITEKSGSTYAYDFGLFHNGELIRSSFNQNIDISSTSRINPVSGLNSFVTGDTLEFRCRARANTSQIIITNANVYVK